MNAPTPGEIRPNSTPSTARCIADNLVRERHPLAGDDDFEITMPRFRLAALLAEAIERAQAAGLAADPVHGSPVARAGLADTCAQVANLSDLMHLIGTDATGRDVRALAWTVHNLLESVVVQLDPPPPAAGATEG